MTTPAALEAIVERATAMQEAALAYGLAAGGSRPWEAERREASQEAQRAFWRCVEDVRAEIASRSA